MQDRFSAAESLVLHVHMSAVVIGLTLKGICFTVFRVFYVRGVRLAKMILVRFSVQFCKKLRFSVWFRFYEISHGFGFFGSVFCNVCCLMCMTLEIYFRAELVQLNVSRSDSELEVQR